MYNYFMIIGKLKEVKNNRAVIRVQRPFLNPNGEREFDDIEVLISNFFNEAVEGFIDKWVSIKGRIKSYGEPNYEVDLIAERIMLLDNHDTDISTIG